MEHWTEVRMKHVEKIRAVNDIKKRKNCTKTAGVSDHSHAVLRHMISKKERIVQRQPGYLITHMLFSGILYWVIASLAGSCRINDSNKP